MDECGYLIIAWTSCSVAFWMLILHHWCIHDNIRDPFERFFQQKDLCNFYHFNHEMFVVAFWLCGLGCGVAQAILVCKSGIGWFIAVYSIEFLFVLAVLCLQASRRESSTANVLLL